MSHPYKDKACGGRAMAAKRYADGGEIGFSPEKMMNAGLKTLAGDQQAPKDENFDLKLKFMDLKPPGKAQGGSAALPKLPMKLKMMKLKGMK
tara:strand:- start:88 stop:363 length:276 start_codon:yes stop_codon:yes gene_type:complete